MQHPLQTQYVDTYYRGFRRLETAWAWTKFIVLTTILIAMVYTFPIVVGVTFAAMFLIFGGWALALFVIHARAIGRKAEYARITRFPKREQEVLRLSTEYPCTAAVLEWLGRTKDKKNKNEAQHDESKKSCCSGDHR